MISIIIVNYHVKKELFSNLQSIYAAKAKSAFEIIVVDNDENKTIEKDLKKQFPKVRYIKNNNKGFGQGNNVGAKYAKGDYLFFLNPDTTITKNTIDLLISYLNFNKKVGIVAPLLYDTNEKIVPLQGARELTPLRAIFSFSFLNTIFPNNPISKHYWYLDDWNKKSVKEVESIPGTAFVIRREIYEQIQGFDEKFFLYFEEQDLCKRVKELGWKIVMIPQAKVFHILGGSTKHVKQKASKIFQQSRFYYLKKHFGFFNAIVSEMVLRTGKYELLLFLVLVLGGFLRVTEIEKTMHFIGDQGWFYLSTRDMLLTGQIPLVGITSSHPWLHQGAFWTYLLAPVLLFSNFNPISGAYLSVSMGLLAIWGIYKLGSEMFSRQLGFIAALLYATSPLIIASDRMPYHTSPIPLFMISALYCLYKWVQGNSYFFPALIVILGILYNFELATFLFSGFVALVFFYGLITKKNWIKDVFNKKILLLSFAGWIIVMLPMLIYDITHGFPQTVKLLVWVGYRILVFLGYSPINPISNVSFSDMFTFVTKNFQQLIFSYNGFFALFIFIASVCVLFSQIFNQEKKKTFILLMIINLFLVIGLFIAKTPSDAYLPLLFPSSILMIAILFDWLIVSRFRLIGIIGLLVLILSNSYSVIQTSFLDTSFTQRLDAAKYIVKEAGEKEYNLKGTGTSSEFESFTMNYEYLTWWLGHGPSKIDQSLVFVVSEQDRKTTVEKEEISNKK